MIGRKTRQVKWGILGFLVVFLSVAIGGMFGGEAEAKWKVVDRSSGSEVTSEYEAGNAFILLTDRDYHDAQASILAVVDDNGKIQQGGMKNGGKWGGGSFFKEMSDESDSANPNQHTVKLVFNVDWRPLWGGIITAKYTVGQTAFTDFYNQIAEQAGDNVIVGVPVGNTADNKIADQEAQKVQKDMEEREKQQNGETKQDCWSGAGSLGFPLCPILDGLANATQGIYSNFIEPSLQVDTVLLNSNGGNTPTYNAWSIFRNFSNIIFVILILVVIISQLTGVGISNYGIKKILPKLVVAAVLINLSFIICQLAVDVSNIVGSGLKSFMSNLGTSIQISQNPEHQGAKDQIVLTGGSTPSGETSDNKTPDPVVTGISTVSSIGITILSVAGFVGWVGGQGIAALFVLLLALLSIAVTLLTFFLLLAVRKAGVVVLVVISPLAFVCYMLPNTKNLFDKWAKAMKGLLLLFPICGFVMGAGDFVSRLLLSTGAGQADFFLAATAMIVGIAPLFFIPTLLKNSMAALGNIGAKISGIGSKYGKGAVDRYKKTEGYQMRQARRAAGKTGGLRERFAQTRFGKATGARNNMARSRMKYKKMTGEQGALDAMFGKDYLLSTQVANAEQAIMAKGEFNNEQTMENGLLDALRTNDHVRINAYTNLLTKKGDSGRAGVIRAWDKAQDEGIEEAAQQAFANNILNNHNADYKNNARTMYQIASDINQGNTYAGARRNNGSPNINMRKVSDYNEAIYNDHGNIVSTREQMQGKVKAATATMDSGEFERIYGSNDPHVLSGSSFSDETRQTAYEVLHSDAAVNLKQEEKERWEAIAGNYIPPEVALQQQSLQTQHRTFAQQQGRDHRGEYPLPAGYHDDITRPGIAVSSDGRTTYDRRTNQFH